MAQEAVSQPDLDSQTPANTLDAEIGIPSDSTSPTPEQSPVLDDGKPDTQDTAPDTHGPEDDTNKDTVAQPQDDGTDWKKRHGDAVRWAQQQKQAAERAAQEAGQLRQFIQRYEKAGLDFTELDKYIEGQTGTPGGKTMDTPAKQEAPQNFVTTEQVNDLINRYNYDISKRDFVSTNPDFKDPDTQELIDIEATKLASEQLRQYGAVTSTFDELIANAGKRVVEKINKFKGLGAKSATEKRQKVDDTAITDGASTKKQPASDDEPEYNAKQFIQSHRERLAKMKGTRF